MFPTTSLALGYWDLSATSSWRVIGWIHITRSPLKHTCFCSLLFWVCRKRMQKEFRPYMKPRIPYMKPKILPSDWWGPVAPTSGWQLAILHPFLCCHWLKSPTPTEVFLSLWKCYSKKQTNKKRDEKWRELISDLSQSASTLAIPSGGKLVHSGSYLVQTYIQLFPVFLTFLSTVWVTGSLAQTTVFTSRDIHMS